MYEIFPKIGFNYKDILIFLKLYFFTLFLGKEEKIVTEHKKLYDWHNNFSPAGLLLCPKDFKIAMIFGLWENKIATICYVLFLKNHLQLKKKVKAVTNPYSWVQIGNYLYNFIILINNYHFYVQVNVYSIF